METIAETAYRDDAMRWAACLSRDPTADGSFYFGVLSTGIYCYPSCGARRPRREQVRFYADAADAERAGLRPCRRCHPDQPRRLERYRLLIARACRELECALAPPDLTQLASRARLSRFHFHRLFKRATGLTPAGYRNAQRARGARDALPRASSVTRALYDAGYASGGRFYQQSAQALGMSVAAYRGGGRGEIIRFALGRCSLGELLVAATARGVCAILLGEDPDALLQDLQRRFEHAELVGADPDFERLIARVAAQLDQPRLPWSLPLPFDVQGTAFQHRVWQALSAVPCGDTVSYAQLAQRLGIPRAVRAVAQAVAANPLAVAIPCHRVIRTDGSLSGYRWGVARKQQLLEREAAAVDTHRPALEPLREGAAFLPGFAAQEADQLPPLIAGLLARAPLRHMLTPGGARMSVAMSNCGDLGWITDRRGYRYERCDPQSAQPWPPMPAVMRALAQRAAAAAGYTDFQPDACLINHYVPGARLTLHQDRNERDLAAPVVSLSLGLPAVFLFGGLTRRAAVQRILLSHGDVLIWGGRQRLAFHGIAALADGEHALTGRCRINLTFRRAT